MTNSTYIPLNWATIDSTKVNLNVGSISGMTNPQGSASLSYVLTDDSLVYGLEFICTGAAAGDSISVQVLSGGVVIAAPVNNWYVLTDNEKVSEYLAAVPKKLLAGMTLNVVYNSIGTAPAQIFINYRLLTVLV